MITLKFHFWNEYNIEVLLLVTKVKQKRRNDNYCHYILGNPSKKNCFCWLFWTLRNKNATETQVHNNQPVGVCLEDVPAVFSFQNVSMYAKFQMKFLFVVFLMNLII
jgi:hypothetical protein